MVLFAGGSPSSHTFSKAGKGCSKDACVHNPVPLDAQVAYYPVMHIARIVQELQVGKGV